MKADALAGTLFYRGQIGDRLHLYSDFSYNYYYNYISNEYHQTDVSNYGYWDVWDEYKNQTAFNLEGKYLLSGRLSAEAGFSNIRRQYASESSQGRGFLDYTETRNKFFAYLSLYLSEKAGLKTGAALEHINATDRDHRDAYLRLLPFFQFSYRFGPAVNILANYSADQSYPSLYQLSPMALVIDTFLTQIGNPAVRSSIRHHAFAELTLWNRLKITPRFDYTRDGFSEVYDRIDNKLYRTFSNVDFREFSLQASCDQMIGTFFRLKNSLVLYRSEALHSGSRNTLNSWLLQSSVNFFHPGKAFSAEAGYYRNMRKNILWQGYESVDKDYWLISLQKELWHKRLSVSLSYIPPVEFGVRRYRTKEMNTLRYGEKTGFDLSPYNNLLLLKISLRLGKEM
jgi:hypothetical protein